MRGLTQISFSFLSHQLNIISASWQKFDHMPSVVMLDWMFVTVRLMHYITNTRAEILHCDYGYDSDVIDTVGSIKETIITEENATET